MTQATHDTATQGGAEDAAPDAGTAGLSAGAAPDAAVPPTFVEPRPMEDDEPVLFAGDTGTLPYEARRAFALLLQRRYVAAADHPTEWKALLAHQQVLESRCHDMFVELVVDRDYEIAYKRQVREDGLAIPVLLKDEPYRRVETLLMLFVRNRFRQEHGAGQTAAFVDAEELVDYALGFLAHDETNLAARRREVDNAIATLARERVLDEVATGRYRILPVVEILLPVDRLRELTRWLRDPVKAAADPAVEPVETSETTETAETAEEDE